MLTGAACSATARAIVETPLEYVKVSVLFTEFSSVPPFSPPSPLPLGAAVSSGGGGGGGGGLSRLAT